MSSKIFKGWQAKIYIHGLEIGCCKNVTVDYNSPIEPYYEIENPNMVHFDSPEDHLGLITISGTITRAWVNTYYLKLLFGGVEPVIPNSEFDLILQASSEIESPILYLYQCRFTKGTINIPANGWLEESYDFIGLRASVQEVPEVPIEHIVNGGLETGDFTGWYSHVNCIISNVEHHTGIYSCKLGWSAYLYQQFDPVLKEDIESFTVWAKQGDFPGQRLTVNLWDTWGHMRQQVFILTSDWQQFNLKNILDNGSSCYQIELFSTYGSNIFIDDLSLMA